MENITRNNNINIQENYLLNESAGKMLGSDQTDVPKTFYQRLSKANSNMSKTEIRTSSLFKNFDHTILSKKSSNEIKYRKSKTKFTFQRSKVLSDPELPILRKRKRKNERILNKLKNVFDSCEEKEMILDHEPPILITLDSQFKKIWEYFMLFTIAYSSFITPYILCFELENHYIKFIDVLIEISLIFDIILSFLSQVEDEMENKVNSSFLIMKMYFEGWFFLDLFTCFPASLMSSFWTANKALIYLQWVALIRLLKIIKYPFFMKHKFSKNLRLDRVFKQILFICVFFNILACFFVFVGVQGEPISWIGLHLEKAENHFEVYFASLYYHILLLFTVGFAGITPSNFNEYFYTVFYITISFIILPLILISISKLFIVENKIDLLLKTKLDFYNKLEEKFDLPPPLKKTIIKQVVFSNSKQYDLRENFFSSLPLVSRNLILNYLFKTQMKYSLFFKNKNCDFINFTLPFLKNSHFEKNKVLYERGYFVEEMYLVTRGKIAVSLGADFLGLELAHIKENQYFGDIFLETSKISPFELRVKSRSGVEVFSISHKNFHQIKEKYQKEIVKILEKSTIYLDTINKRKRHLIQLLNWANKKEGVITAMNKINQFLLVRDFDNYYFDNQKMQDINDFLITNKFDKVKNIVRFMEKNNINYAIDSEYNYFKTLCTNLNSENHVRFLEEDNAPKKFFENTIFNLNETIKMNETVQNSKKRKSIFMRLSTKAKASASTQYKKLARRIFNDKDNNSDQNSIEKEKIMKKKISSILNSNRNTISIIHDLSSVPEDETLFLKKNEVNTSSYPQNNMTFNLDLFHIERRENIEIIGYKSNKNIRIQKADDFIICRQTEFKRNEILISKNYTEEINFPSTVFQNNYIKKKFGSEKNQWRSSFYNKGILDNKIKAQMEKLDNILKLFKMVATT